MILVDANLLLYAVNRDLPPHPTARIWFEDILSGNERVGFPWVVLLAFLRIATSKRIFERPLPVEKANAYVDEWLSQPVATTLVPGAAHWAILRNLLNQTGTGGNLTTDAHIAALALEHGCTVCSIDNDFKRFPGLRHIDPLK
ncbi:type II toxin-antitoxin system VapC family toxin [Methylohalobius crimeensis]|uniref:type II toxin-antitoxin system VapC family toxin n=1 Tax=Methylohalobius crimeensis TaxID=244365 RepID=UPI0003B3E805|nr:type II toxin-antitoxin system VapC family toxin [Methylohalobius crimeensis]